jgi:hypothetical protein
VRLLIIAPHALDRRQPSETERKYLATLDRALDGLRELRARKAGVVSLRTILMDAESDPLLVSSRVRLMLGKPSCAISKRNFGPWGFQKRT